MKKVVIVDYGLGNLYSIQQACIHVGYNPVISGDPKEIISADRLILPGVGAFNVAMESLKASKMIDVLNAYVSSGKPLMGVCLGMQLLFERSEEFGNNEGLGFVRGEVIRFPSSFRGEQLKIPNIGWCRIFPTSSDWQNTPLSEIDPERNHMYFIHSYHALPSVKENALSYTDYNEYRFISSVRSDNIWGFQFHPEKSGEEGLSIYKNFLNL